MANLSLAWGPLLQSSKDQLRPVETGLCSVFKFSDLWWTVDRTAVTVLNGLTNLRSWQVLVRSGSGLFPVTRPDLQTLDGSRSGAWRTSPLPSRSTLLCAPLSWLVQLSIKTPLYLLCHLIPPKTRSEISPGGMIMTSLSGHSGMPVREGYQL